MDQNIVDPDDSLIYIKRKQHNLCAEYLASGASTSKHSTHATIIAESNTNTPQSFQRVAGVHQFSKQHFLIRVVIDKHVNQPGKSLGVGSRHNLPTGMLMPTRNFNVARFLYELKCSLLRRRLLGIWHLISVQPMITPVNGNFSMKSCDIK